MYTSPLIAAPACREMHIKSLIKFIDESLVTSTLGNFASGSGHFGPCSFRLWVISIIDLYLKQLLLLVHECHLLMSFWYSVVI